MGKADDAAIAAFAAARGVTRVAEGAAALPTDRRYWRDAVRAPRPVSVDPTIVRRVAAVDALGRRGCVNRHHAGWLHGRDPLRAARLGNPARSLPACAIAALERLPVNAGTGHARLTRPPHAAGRVHGRPAERRDLRTEGTETDEPPMADK